MDAREERRVTVPPRTWTHVVDDADAEAAIEVWHDNDHNVEFAVTSADQPEVRKITQSVDGWRARVTPFTDFYANDVRAADGLPPGMR
jgi:hypothetical protein